MPKELVKVTSIWLEVERIESSTAAAGFIVFKEKGEYQMSSITVPDNSPGVSATVQFLDAEGHPTTADDTPQWSSTDEAVAVVTPAADGLSAQIEIGSPGASVIEVRSTNDDGSEVVLQGTITAQPGDAVIGEITFTENT